MPKTRSEQIIELARELGADIAELSRTNTRLQREAELALAEWDKTVRINSRFGTELFEVRASRDRFQGAVEGLARRIDDLNAELAEAQADWQGYQRQAAELADMYRDAQAEIARQRDGWAECLEELVRTRAAMDRMVPIIQAVARMTMLDSPAKRGEQFRLPLMEEARRIVNGLPRQEEGEE